MNSQIKLIIYIIFNLIYCCSTSFAECTVVIKNNDNKIIFQEAKARAEIPSIMLVVPVCSANSDMVKPYCIKGQFGNPHNILFTKTSISCSGAPGAKVYLTYNDIYGSKHVQITSINNNQIKNDMITLNFPENFKPYE